MAQQGAQLDEEQLCCSVCLDVLKEPVTVPCGHSYCRRCIEGYWDQDDQRGRYSCPQCRHVFVPRPILKKNTMLAEVVECMKKTGLQAVPPDHCYAGPGDVACDVCTGRRLKAVKTCLQCLVSYCDTHLQPHHQSPAFKKHKLVKALGELQENKCPLHNKARKLFCRTDQQCICSLCSVEEHKGHDMISAAAARTERQNYFDTIRHNIQQRIQEREEELNVLQWGVEDANLEADEAVKNIDGIFTELISSMERRRSEARELIRDRQERQVSCFEELKRLTNLEVAELRSRPAELEQLSLTEDHIHFLQRYTSSLCTISESTHPVSYDVSEVISDVNDLSRYFQDVTVSVSNMRDKLEGILTEEGTAVLETVNSVKKSKKKKKKKKKKTTHKAQALLSTLLEPKTRDEFLEYSRPITLDPNTAHQLLSLSNGDRKVTQMDEPQSYPDHAERFTWVPQVLSREGMSGRCYWEAEWDGSIAIIGVSYKYDISTGCLVQCPLGLNDKSWALMCTQQGYVFRHGDIDTDMPSDSVVSRVGVYLDHSAGILSFYSVTADTMTLLHRVHTTFTHNLHAGISELSSGTTVELCDLK